MVAGSSPAQPHFRGHFSARIKVIRPLFVPYGAVQGRYIGPVWIGICCDASWRHGVSLEREHRIIIDVNGVQNLTVDQARRLGEEALALADQLQARLGPASPF